MNFNPKDFVLSFQDDAAPAWTCPECSTPSLRITRSNLSWHQQVNSEDDSYLDEAERAFDAKVTCSNASCDHIMHVSGTGYIDCEYHFTDDGDLESSNKYVLILNPKFFHPQLNLLPINGKTYKHVPQEMKDMLTTAGVLFWVDQKACANRLRQAIEGILNIANVPFDRRLHNRIKGMKGTIIMNLQDSFLSVKIIGNAGSHNDYDFSINEQSDFQLSVDDLLHAFNVIDSSLMIIYDKLNRADKDKELKEKSKSITDRYAAAETQRKKSRDELL